MTRPYISFQIDALEAEYERAREIGDSAALKNLTAELTQHGRRQTPRVARLAALVGEVLNGSAVELWQSEPDGRDLVSSDRRQRNDLSVRAVYSNQRERREAPQQGPRPKFKPTPEQEEAVELFKTGEHLKINAYAGTGKTSTLQLLAHSARAKGQYLAFNRRIVFDSREKFPSDVNCSTTHSLAYRSLIGRYAAEQMTKRINANELVEVLGLKSWRIDRNHVLAGRSQAYLILATIRRYCQSDKVDFIPEHVPRHGSLAAASEQVIEQVTEVALQGARHVWERMLAPHDPLPLGHDGYLKAWALGGPMLPADYIMLDEAQDTNPVVLDVLKRQSAQIVYVGDKYQQIYEWRGAVNAMEDAAAPHIAHLTTSFRFGGEAAWAANQVLHMLGETRPLQGNPGRETRIVATIDGAVLARTNATTITACIEALDAGQKPHLVGGTDDLIKMLRGVQDLKQGRPSSVSEFFGFENWQQVLEFVKSGEGEDLLTFVNLVESRGEAQLLWALNRVVDEEDADVVISTAHKAKGREWDNVRLMDDFLKSLPLKDDKRQPTGKVDPAELRLLYVALTRAKDAMAVPAPLLEFLKTGVLPKTADEEIATGAAHPKRVPTPPLPQPQTNWSPPTNWQSPVAPTTPPAVPHTLPVQQRPSVPVAPKKKLGLLGRLFK